MINKKRIITLCLFFVLSFAGCQENVVKIEETVKLPESTVTANPSLGLTTDQKLQDFDYMYNVLKENYPFFWVNQRVNGVDWLAKKDEYISKIKETRTDGEFGNVLSTILQYLHNGHTQLITSESTYANIIKAYEISGNRNTWVEELKKTASLKRYNYASDNQISSTAQLPTNTSSPRLFKSDIIVPNQIAYLKVGSFNNFSVQSDRAGILDFYQKIKNYPILIIDIRQNSGGSDSYWMKNIIPPLIKEGISAEFYILFRGGSYSEPFIKSLGITLAEVSSLDKKLVHTLPEEAAEKFKYAMKHTRTVNSSDYVGFKGKVYLLVDRKVYSSSESFAAFCKATQWATLVGEKTGGDGIGIDPLFLSLPNSGYIARFSWDMGLNPDGTCNEEKKTEPDIKVDATIGSSYEQDKAIQEVLKLNKLTN